MEIVGWVKVYRKTLDNGILRDATAWTIFSWLLLKVNDKGKKVIGRFWASDELGLNSNTFYKALKRLEEKWHMVTLSGNNRNTEVCIVNWAKYQNPKRLSNTPGNNRVTTGQQLGNTLIEYRIKNKEEPFNEKRIKELKEKAHFLIGKKI